jgi:hypothetical protein
VSIVNASGAIDTVEWMKRERYKGVIFALPVRARVFDSVFSRKRERSFSFSFICARLSLFSPLEVVRSKVIESIDAHRISISETALASGNRDYRATRVVRSALKALYNLRTRCVAIGLTRRSILDY